MQTGKYGEAKFIKLLSGELIWFTIDLRKSSRTFGKNIPFKLSLERFYIHQEVLRMDHSQ